MILQGTSEINCVSVVASEYRLTFIILLDLWIESQSNDDTPHV